MVSEFVNKEEYSHFRLADEDEELGWPASMKKLLDDLADLESCELTSEDDGYVDRSPGGLKGKLGFVSAWTKVMNEESDIRKSLKTGIRRGVCDRLKYDVWRKANGCDVFMKAHTSFYNSALKSTFGTHVPTELGTKNPTFCGGVLGFYEDISRTSYDVDKLDRSELPTSGIHFIENSAADFLRSVFPSSPSVSPNQKFGFRKNRDISSEADISLPLPKSLSGSGNILGLETPRQKLLSRRQKQSQIASHSDIGFHTIKSSPQNTQAPLQFLSETPSNVADSKILPVSSNKPSRWKSFRFFNKLMKHNKPENKQKNTQQNTTKIPESQTPQQNPTTPDCIDDAPDFRIYTDSANQVVPNIHLTHDSTLPNHQIAHQRNLDVYKLEDVTDFQALLTESGRNAVKRLLWVTNDLHGSEVEFCPIIPNLYCLLIMYMDESTAFCVVHCLVKASIARNASEDPRPFLIYRRKEFVRFVKVVISGVHRRLNRLYSHLRHLQVDLIAWAARSLQDGFARTLPFDFALRIYGTYLFEGAKTLYRYVLAILKTLEESLFKCTTTQEAESVLYDLTNDEVFDLNALTKLAYRFRIHSKKHFVSRFGTHCPSPYLMSTRIHHFYRPRITAVSHILAISHFEVIWSWLASTTRILDPVLAYRSSSDGMSISALLKVLAGEEDRPMIYVLKTQDAAIIGGFAPYTFSLTPKTASAELHGDSFIFTLAPEEACYWWTGKNRSLLDCSRNNIMIGSDEIALFVDSEIKTGRSRPSASFNSPALVSQDDMGFFQISVFEVWLLK